MQKSSLLASALFFALFGCTFAPKDKFVNPISQPPSSIKVSVDIQNSNFKDPFNLNAVTTFNFKIDSTTKPILDYQVLLDNRPIIGVTVNKMLLSFTLDPSTLFDGNHAVKILIKLDSKSGSLANYLGVEYYTVEKDFTVVVDKTPPSYTGGPIIFAIENGFLTLTWTKSDKNNFTYLIKHSNSYVGGDTLIADPSINKFIDRGYIGGPINYTISAVLLNSPPISLVSGSFSTRPVNLKVSLTSAGVQSLSWSATKLSTTNASISMQIRSWYTTVPISQGSVPVNNSLLGDANAISIHILRNIQNAYPKYSYDTSLVYTSINNFPKFNSFHATESQKLLLSNSTHLTRLDLQKLMKEDSIPYSGSPLKIAVSGDGGSGLIFDYYSSFYNFLYKFNPGDFSQFHGNYFLNYSGPFKGGQTNISTGYTPNNVSSISNTKLGGINYRIFLDPVNSYDPRSTAGIWDFSSGKVAWADTSNIDTPLISTDGNYFVVNSHAATENLVYQNNAGSWSFIGKVPLGTRLFRNRGTTELIVITSTSVIVFDLAQAPDSNYNFKVVRSFSVDQSPPPNTIAYDPASECIYFEYIGQSFYNSAFNYYTRPSTIKVYGIGFFDYKGSGDAIIDAPTSDQATVHHVYSNGYHFLSSGYSEKIK
jgi:hypothetical protein